MGRGLAVSPILKGFQTGAITADLHALKQSHQFLATEVGIADPLLVKFADFLKAAEIQDQKAVARLGAELSALLAARGAALTAITLGMKKRRVRRIDFQHPINRFRLALGVREGTLYVRGRNTGQPPFPGLIEDHLFAYEVNPLAHPDPSAWLKMLQATFYAALDRSFEGQEEIFSGRDCLDRALAWPIAVEAYVHSLDKKIHPKDLARIRFHPYWFMKKDPAAIVPDRGVLRPTFREMGLTRPYAREIFIVEPTRQEINRAKRGARRHLKRNPPLLLLRKRWLQTRGGQVEEVRQIYLEALARSFGFIQIERTSKTSHVNQNPDLFLLYQFLKEILWERFLKTLQVRVSHK